MRGLCGWFSTRSGDDGAATLRLMLAANNSTTENAELKTTPQSGLAVFGTAARPRLLEADGFLLAIVGHPRLRDADRRVSNELELLRALQARGKSALTDIGGDFALAAWDSRLRRGLLAIDHIGVHQLVYGRANGSLVFASNLDLLGGFPGVRRELSKQGLYDYLYYHVSPGPHTIYTGLTRVRPGQCVEFGHDGNDTASTYWSMGFQEVPHLPYDSLKQEFVSLMQGAVQESTEGLATTGAFLSGGTDSSTVSGMLARVRGGPVPTFSIGFDVEGYDEMAYARIAAKHYGCEHHEYYVTPKDVVDAVPRIAASYDQPFGNASAIPTYYCAKLASDHGVNRLLAGDGGDELFGGNERYAKQHLLGLYQNVPQALRRGLIEPLMLSTPGLRHLPGLSKLRSYVEQARPAMPQRYASYNLLMHLGHANVLTADFRSAVDADHPHKLLAEAHAPFASASLVNQMMGIDLRFILADGDLPKVTHMCELAGVDVAFPILDDRVVDFSQKLASDLKLRGTTLRWFFKEALKDFLPPAVITKQKHGFGLPVGAWLVGHKPLFDLAADGIGLLRQRGIVEPKFIDELLHTRLRQHPAYYGTMAWVLMMLGLWLDSRKL
jgi:asparagine synthase (glutamine-hydrolysing)